MEDAPAKLPLHGFKRLPTPAARLFQTLTGNAYLMLLAAMMLWAMNTVAARLAVGNISPMLLVLLRWVLACAVLMVIAREPLRKDWPVLRTRLPFIFIMGALGYTAFNALFYVAGHHTTAINIGILQGSMPILVLVAGALALRETANAIQWLGTGFTILGIAVVASGGDLTRLASLRINIGDIYMLIACVLYAGYTVGLRRRPAASSLGFFAVMAGAATITSVPLAAAEFMGGAMLWPTWKGWLLVLFIGLGPSLLAQLTFMRGVQLIGPVRSGIFINLVPVIGPVFAILILGEQFGWHHGLALGLVLGGIAVAERGRTR
jgi:drug/metabolite transporter (DMT)-like permease